MVEDDGVTLNSKFNASRKKAVKELKKDELDISDKTILRHLAMAEIMKLEKNDETKKAFEALKSIT